ncbi:NYN domain-containing protein [Limimaricola pyoseonensis]|uniref:Uncharacterized conserved protein, LabA/DUF88 family n=1 Tax=Limimaricola pyoseonensis TaxID=521013 RepID=A0A1G7BZZ6_9RHOB|nr:NYN domain-containing protein [Limimaricola pyoseonensis]SDE32609.1 Uncharacterized conserved protein, LabA/DUF88 family [Limimaricola pyoseonensis]
MTHQPIPPRRSIAVLIDGDNLSAAHAAAIDAALAQEGERRIARVYGDAQKIQGWERLGGYVVVHAGVGKNAADLRLCIDAMDLAHRVPPDSFVLASSDGDFLHLAHHLREAGFRVIGLGEAKTPRGFRRACSRFELLGPIAAPSPAAPPLSQLDTKLRLLITEGGTAKGMPLSLLGVQMHKRFRLTGAAISEAGWGAYLRSRPALYDCDPKGPAAKVRWVGPTAPAPA